MAKNSFVVEETFKFKLGKIHKQTLRIVHKEYEKNYNDQCYHIEITIY